MKRLYYLVDSQERVRLISRELFEGGLKESDFHVLCRDKQSFDGSSIHTTTRFHERDLIRYAERGALLAITASATLLTISNLTEIWSTTVLIAMFVIVVSVLPGMAIGGYLGYSSENYKIRRFHEKIEQGFYLVMIDVVTKYADLIRHIIHKECGLKEVAFDDTLVFPFDKAPPSAQ